MYYLPNPLDATSVAISIGAFPERNSKKIKSNQKNNKKVYHLEPILSQFVLYRHGYRWLANYKRAMITLLKKAWLTLHNVVYVLSHQLCVWSPQK